MTYQKWFEIACALKHELGEDGPKYFHEISQFHPKYNERETNKQFEVIKYTEEKPITIATFFQIAKEHGLGNISLKFNFAQPALGGKVDDKDRVNGKDVPFLLENENEIKECQNGGNDL